MGMYYYLEYTKFVNDMNNLIKWFDIQIKVRESDNNKGYLNEYGKGYLDGLKESLKEVKNTNIEGKPCECGNKTFIHRHSNWIECTACNQIKIL